MLSRQPGFCFGIGQALAAALLHPGQWCSLPCPLSNNLCSKVWKLNLQIPSPNRRAVCGRIPPLPRHYVSSSSSFWPQLWQGMPAKTSAVCLFVCLCFAVKLKIGKLLCFFFKIDVNKTNVSQHFYPLGLKLLISVKTPIRQSLSNQLYSGCLWHPVACPAFGVCRGFAAPRVILEQER